MARKKLLTEGEIRQFMKLANLRPLGQSRLSEMGAGGYGGGMPGQRDDDMGDEMPADDMEPEGDEEMDMDMDMGAEDDMDMDMGAEGGGDMVSMSDFMDALEMAIEDVTGEPASVEEAPGEGEEDMDMDAGADLDAGADMDMDAGGDMGGDEDEPMMESNEDKIVAEVARRVAARLQKENRKEQMADQLAERIMKRLVK